MKSDSGNGSGNGSGKDSESGKEFDILLDVMTDILEAIRELPYRIGGSIRDDRFHKECPSCGKQVSKLQGAAFCPYCGYQAFSEEEVNVNLKVCLGCDILYDFHFSHCPYCGKEFFVLPDNIHIDMMAVIYERMEGASSLEGGLSLDEIPAKDIVKRIKGLKEG